MKATILQFPGRPKESNQAVIDLSQRIFMNAMWDIYLQASREAEQFLRATLPDSYAAASVVEQAAAIATVGAQMLEKAADKLRKTAEKSQHAGTSKEIT